MSLITAEDCAGKGETERAAWQFCREHKPQFVFNTLLPAFVLGPAPNPAIHAPSTVGMAYKLFKANPTSPLPLYCKPSTTFVDIRDTAVLHVAALLAPDVVSERLWAYGHSVHINDVLRYWREAFPEKQDIIPQDMDYQYVPLQFPDQSRSEELLQRFAGRKWLDVKDTVVNTIPRE